MDDYWMVMDDYCMVTDGNSVIVFDNGGDCA